MSVDPIFWLLAAIGFVVLEAMTLNLVSIWFAVGSAAALLSCLVTGSFRVQAVVFVAVSTLCLLALKPLCSRLRKPPTATNGDRALGRTPGQSCRVAEIHSTLLIVEPVLTETAAPAAH